jgi:hypothetical protein
MAQRRRTAQLSTLHLTPSRLADFPRIVTGSRRGLVRCLEFDIVLDTYGKELFSKYETRIATTSRPGRIVGGAGECQI